MRAIDADAFKEYITGACEDMKHLFNDNGAVAKLITESFCKDIDEQPTIQPKRGKWIEDKGQQILMQNAIERGEVWRVCSVCGAGHMIGHKYATDKAYHDRHHNYCPNCGAKMEVTT